jgi:hypothetical protein
VAGERLRRNGSIDLTRRAARRLESIVRPLGFAPDRAPDERTFFRSVDGRTEMLHVSCIRHPNELDVTLGVALRFELVARWFSRVGLQNLAHVGCELGNLVNQGQRRYRLNGSPSDEVQYDRVRADLERDALPWFEKYGQLSAVLSALIQEDRFARLLSPLRESRQLTGMVLAVELDDRASFERLAERYADPGAFSQIPESESARYTELLGLLQREKSWSH